MHASQGPNGGFGSVAPARKKGDGAGMWSVAYNITMYEYWRSIGDTTLLKRWYPHIKQNADLYLARMRVAP